MSSPIITGDLYLASLLKFIDANTAALLDGTLTLKLNPVGLHYVQSRLDSLSEINSLLSSAPVDYLRAYVSDLGDHRALEQLRRILGLLTSLKVVSGLGFGVRDRTPVSLAGFGRVRSLELRGCDLSTVRVKGLLELKWCLERIVCHNSTDALRHVFASRIVDIKDSPVWTKLMFVSCACNDLVLMDESLQLLPIVETLDLSRNQFAKLANLRKCTKLQHLDLGFNHLRSISSLSEVSCPIVKLVLRNNALTTLRGIENLKSLEGLDLSYNIISCFTELEILASLPCLQNLWLEGNPLYCARWYRSQVFSFFPHPESLILDDHGINTREYWERHIILASRQKLPSGYGFYFPAKDEAEDGGSFDTKTEGNLKTRRKKYSRLASIEDEEQGIYLSPEAEEQESMSCDTDNQTKDENCISDGESKIVSLMNKIEYMKKERSVLWLREFKEWMDQAPDDNGNQCTRFNGEMYINQSEGERRTGESSEFIEGDNKPTFLGSDTSFTGPSNCDNGNSYFNTNDNGYDARKTILGTRVSLEKDVEKTNYWEPHKLSHLNVNASTHFMDVVENSSSASLNAIDEIIGSRPPSTDPRSPPHYQEDILQRRLYLEEEFLQLSAESRSLASSDSDTSSSEDGSCSSGASVAEHSVEQDFTYEPTEITESNTDIHFSEADTDDGLSEYNCGMDRDKGKKKLKRRDFSLLGNTFVTDFNKEFHKDNGTLEICENDGKRQPSCSESYINESYERTSEYSNNPDQDQFIKNYFHLNLADSKTSETCQQLVHCRCVYQLDSSFHEGEVYILRSSKKILYILLVDVITHGQEATPKLLRCHKLEALRELMVGMGLQTLRVHMEGDVTYIFLPRTSEESKYLFYLFGVGPSSELSTGCSLQSWEQVQVKLLEKYICGSLRMGLVLYSMLLFWHDNHEGESWLLRSLFVVEGCLLVCIENLVHFGCFDDGTNPPYYSLDNFCAIRNILEMVIELKNDKCLTLTLKNVSSDSCPAVNVNVKTRQKDTRARVLIWKFKWFSEESLLKFVAVVKAIHLGLTSSALPVKYIS